MILRFTRDDNGGVLVEATIMITIMFVFVLGSVDFLFAFYQWNAATKAVQMGVRIAAVSDPVARGLNGLSAGVVSASLRPGSAMPSFTVTCDGGTATCTCQGACKGVGGYNDAAMRTHCVWTRQHGLWRCDVVLHRRNVRHLWQDYTGQCSDRLYTARCTSGARFCRPSGRPCAHN